MPHTTDIRPVDRFVCSPRAGLARLPLSGVFVTTVVIINDFPDDPDITLWGSTLWAAVQRSSIVIAELSITVIRQTTLERLR